MSGGSRTLGDLEDAAFRARLAPLAREILPPDRQVPSDALASSVGLASAGRPASPDRLASSDHPPPRDRQVLDEPDVTPGPTPGRRDSAADRPSSRGGPVPAAILLVAAFCVGVAAFLWLWPGAQPTVSGGPIATGPVETSVAAQPPAHGTAPTAPAAGAQPFHPASAAVVPLASAPLLSRVAEPNDPETDARPFVAVTAKRVAPPAIAPPRIPPPTLASALALALPATPPSASVVQAAEPSAAPGPARPSLTALSPPAPPVPEPDPPAAGLPSAVAPTILPTSVPPMTVPSPAVTPPGVTPSATSSPTAHPAHPGPEDQRTLAPTDPRLLQLLVRGDAALAARDISAARALFERAATAGSAEAATALGKSYDPAFLSGLGVRGAQPDPVAAAVWYRRAAALGDAEARARLSRLPSAAQQ